jgi:hypothetical protein
MINNSSTVIAFPAFVRMPPRDLSASVTNLTGGLYGDGTYETSESSFWQGREDAKAYNAFNFTGRMWHSEFLYVPATGIYSGSAFTTINGVNYLGEWMQIKLPIAISLDSYAITPRGDIPHFRSPRDFLVLGSNDGTAWTLVHNQTNVNNWNSAIKTFKPPISPAFRYFRLAVSRVGNYDNNSAAWQEYVNVVDWELIAAATTEDSFFVEADSASSVRLQSVKFPNNYLRVNGGLLQVRREASEDTAFRNASLFQIATGFGGLSLPVL